MFIVRVRVCVSVPRCPAHWWWWGRWCQFCACVRVCTYFLKIKFRPCGYCAFLPDKNAQEHKEQISLSILLKEKYTDIWPTTYYVPQRKHTDDGPTTHCLSLKACALTITHNILSLLQCKHTDNLLTIYCLSLNAGTLTITHNMPSLFQCTHTYDWPTTYCLSLKVSTLTKACLLTTHSRHRSGSHSGNTTRYSKRLWEPPAHKKHTQQERSNQALFHLQPQICVVELSGTLEDACQSPAWSKCSTGMIALVSLEANVWTK